MNSILKPSMFLVAARIPAQKGCKTGQDRTRRCERGLPLSARIGSDIGSEVQIIFDFIEAIL